MAAETNELDTREEDFHRNNKTLREWEENEPDTEPECEEQAGSSSLLMR